MNVNKVVKFVDKIVFEKTGKHLDDVQTAVVEGTWNRETYDDIAQKCNVTKNHVGDVGAELWQLLSKALDEDIKKTNFRSTFERLQLTTSQFINIQSSHNFKFCSYPYQDNKNSQQARILDKLFHHDLTLAPQIINFYNREYEIKTISNCILTQNTPLISVLGLSGIGKTTLVKRFVDLNLDKFEIIIWKSLKYPKSLNLFLDDVLQVCKQEPHKTLEDKIKQVFNILKQQKCLIILDDVQNIFVPGEFVGEYQTEYQDYQNFFTMIPKTTHQSNVILVSQEKCTEMQSLDEELYPVQCLELSGLENVEILKNTGLRNQESWLNLIKLYAGNPFFLQSIAVSIKNIFDGEVAEFLVENELVITQDMQVKFNQIFHKISPIEQQIILTLSKFAQPVSRTDLKASLNLSTLSSYDFINGLESLQKRYLVEKTKDEKILFSILPVFREYVRSRII